MRKAPWKKLICPICGKRVLDISKIPLEDVKVTLKCPTCHKLVTVPCTKDSIMEQVPEEQ